MPQHIDVPGMGVVEFPDGMSDEQITAAIQANMPQHESMANKALGAINSAGDSAALGLRHAVSAPAQFLNEGIDAVAGTNLKGSLDAANQRLDRQYAQKNPNPGIVNQTIANTAEFLPSMAVGGGIMSAPLKASELTAKGASGAIKGIAGLFGKGAAGGALSAPLIYDPSGKQSDLEKTAIGGLTGAIAAPALGGAAKIAQKSGGLIGGTKDLISAWTNPAQLAQKQLLGNITNVGDTIATKDAGHRLGINLRPSEASQSTLAALSEAGVGYTKEGAKTLQEEAVKRAQEEKTAIGDLLEKIVPAKESKNASGDIVNISKGIQGQRESAFLNDEKEKIGSFLNELSPAQPENVSSSVRELTGKIIKGKRDALSARAQPLYESAYNETVDKKELNKLMQKDGTIKNAINHVWNDPDYRVELGRVSKGEPIEQRQAGFMAQHTPEESMGAELDKYPKNSIKVLDLAKRHIDSRISQAIQGGDRETARILQGAKSRLVNATDKYSPTYAQARALYSEGAKPIQDLENSNIGKLANLEDTQLNRVTKTIFDPKETNINVMKKIKSEISAESPELWKNIVRSEMERRLDRKSTPLSGENFHSEIFSKKLDRDQFKEAIKGYPGLENKFDELHAQFKNSKQNMRNIQNTDISKISSMTPPQLKNVSKTVFDPSQTNTETFNKLRDTFRTTNPKAWDNLTRNEIERRMSTVKNNRYGSKFYNAILENDNSYNQFLEATKHNPEAQQKLKDMKQVFGSLINMKNAREAYNKRASSLDMPRSTLQLAKQIGKKMVAGEYDAAAVKLIFGKTWDKDLKNIKRTSSKNDTYPRIGKLLESISGTIPTTVQYTLR